MFPFGEGGEIVYALIPWIVPGHEVLVISGFTDPIAAGLNIPYILANRLQYTSIIIVLLFGSKIPIWINSGQKGRSWRVCF